MCEGCCSKEKHGNFLLCGQACSCILSNAHACNEWCRSADLLLERLGSVANVVWWKWCFLLWLVVAGTLVSAELWISILAADLHHCSSSACFLAQVQVLCFSAGTSSCLVCSHLGGSCCRGFSTGMQLELDFLYFLGKKLYFLEVHCFFHDKAHSYSLAKKWSGLDAGRNTSPFEQRCTFVHIDQSSVYAGT